LLDTLLQYDTELLIFLNNLGSSFWDPFWMFITNQLNWTPVFLFIFYLLIKNFGWKKGLFLVVSIAVLVAFSDQFVNLIKESIARIRPNNDPDLVGKIRALLQPQSKSFVSGHATTSMFFTTFIIFLLKEKVKHIYFIIFFPLIFGYSRIYLGVHFPLDICCGYFLGISLGVLYARFVKIGLNRFFI